MSDETKLQAFEDACAELEAVWPVVLDHLQRPAPKNDLAVNHNRVNAEQFHRAATQKVEDAARSLGVDWPEGVLSEDAIVFGQDQVRPDVRDAYERLCRARANNQHRIGLVREALAAKASQPDPLVP